LRQSTVTALGVAMLLVEAIVIHGAGSPGGAGPRPTRAPAAPGPWGIAPRARSLHTLGKSHQNGHDTVVTALLAAGADRTAKDNDGQTAQQLAEQSQHPSTAELLKPPPAPTPVPTKPARTRRPKPAARPAPKP
jgi:hypothetical protein